MTAGWDPAVLDDDALWAACEDDCDGVAVEVLAEQGMAAVDAYDVSGRPPLLAVAMHRLRLVIEGTEEGDPVRPEIATTLGSVFRVGAAVVGQPDLLDDAVEACRIAAEEGDGPGYQSNLGAVLLARYGLTGEEADLLEAMEASSAAVTLAADDDPDRRSYWVNWSVTQRMLGEERADLELLSAAVDAGETACGLAAADAAQITPLLVLEDAVLSRYQYGGEPADLDRAVELAERAARRSQEEAEPRTLACSHACTCRRLRFEANGRPADLDAAVEWAEQAVVLSEEEDYDALIGRAIILTRRFEQNGQTVDIDVALADARRAFGLEPAVAATLAKILISRAERLGEVADLDEAVELMRAVADDESPTLLADLGSVMSARYDATYEQADLDAAIDAFDKGLELTPSAYVDRPAALANAANAYCSRYELLGTVGDLDRAIELDTEALDGLPLDAIDRIPILANLSLACRQRYESQGDREDLELAIAAGEQALLLLSDARGHEYAHVLSGLSACRRTRFGQTGDRDDLDWAVAASRQAVELTSDGDSSVCGRLTNLAVCLLSVYETTAHAASLDEAVRVGRRAVEQTNSGPGPLATAATNLGNVLLTRFELRSAPYDLDDSVAAARRAVELTPADSPFRVARLSNLANVLREKAFRGVEGAADESVKAAELAVGAAEPGDPMLPGFWSNLGLALSTRYDVHARGEDLDRSIEAFREAVRTAEGSEQDALMYRSNLGMALRRRGVANDSPADLDEAIAVMEAVTAADWGGHPDSAPFLLGLGNAYASRVDRSQDPADLAAALSTWRRAAEVIGSSPAVKLQAAQSLGDTAMANGDGAAAASGYGAAIELLTSVVWRGLNRVAQEQLLIGLRTLAASSAAAAIESGDPARAIGLLEAGRSILWQQNIHSRDDLTKLATVDEKLGQRIAELSNALMAGG